MFHRRASSRRMLREPSMRVRESSAEQIEERQSDWSYSRPIVILDLIWNLACIIVSVLVLVMSRNRSSVPAVPKKERHAIRPPVEHNWSLPERREDLIAPQIFQHELLQNFSINMFCKIPVNKVQTYVDLRNVLMKRIFLSALHFRIKSRYKSSSPPFTSIDLDHSDSGREGCTVTTLTVTAEPKSWQGAIKVATQEA